MTMRKLASLQRIKHVRPIPGADSIECVGVLGWDCVSKKGEFGEGDLCVYFEIDSLLPDRPEFGFLRKSCWKDDLGKHRLRTVRLRGQISQGLAMPADAFPNLPSAEVGFDLTEFLGVEKWESPTPAQIAGDARAFSWPISKTDEVRVQQDDEMHFLECLSGRPYYISLKLDGTSCTFIVDPRDGEYHVCGRNYSYRRSDFHSFWRISDRYNLEEGLRSMGGRCALQGEVVGPGIQKNRIGLRNVDFYAFNVIDVSNGSRLHFDEAMSVSERLGVKFVPILERGESFSYSQEELLEMAKGKYRDHFSEAKDSEEREGIVVRSLCGLVSFKAISNEFLLKEK